MHYKGPDFKRIMVSLPVSPIYECFVLTFGIKLLTFLLGRFSTDIYEDRNLLKDLNIDYKYRFAIIYRLG